MFNRIVKFEDVVRISEKVEGISQDVTIVLSRTVVYQRSNYPLNRTSVRLVQPKDIIYAMHVLLTVGEEHGLCHNNSLEWIASTGVEDSLKYITYILYLSDEEANLIRLYIHKLIKLLRDYENSLGS